MVAPTSDTANTILDWLMQGDAAIRWQVMRDLLDAPPAEWQAERDRVSETGWGARLLAARDEAGTWGGGIYTPKWTSTTYTLLMLRDLGVTHRCEVAQCGARMVLDELLGDRYGPAFEDRLARCDHCITGMMLSLAVHFDLHDERIASLRAHLLAEQMDDGGWNCRRHRKPLAHHSSFHTTYNVLDALRTCLEAAPNAALAAAESRAMAFMLQHRLFRSDKTGEIIKPAFLLLSFPTRWQYNVLRGLDYAQRAGAQRDARYADAIALLDERRVEDGSWPLDRHYSGVQFFNMERVGAPSRWNTLRVLRVLRWWNGDTTRS